MEFGASDSNHVFFDDSVDEHSGGEVISFPSFIRPIDLGQQIVVIGVFFSPLEVV